MRSSIELPPLRDHLKGESFTPFQSRPRELLPSILAHSPPGRSTTLPPIQRREKQRPRKSSLGARKAKHERNRSKEFGRRPSLNDRKALSAEPQTAAWMQGKRWEDLIEAATSATEVDDERDRDLTPVRNLDCISNDRICLTVKTSLGSSFTIHPSKAQLNYFGTVSIEKPVLPTSSFPVDSRVTITPPISATVVHGFTTAESPHATAV